MKNNIEELLKSPEPSIRFKIRAGVLGENPESAAMRRLRSEIRDSPRAKAILARHVGRSRVADSHVYRKWTGAHWAAVALAEIGYPAGDKGLTPLLDRVLACWLHPEGIEEHVFKSADNVPYRLLRRGVPVINGRARRCGSQQGNALFSALRLGLADERCDELARLLMRWQWPDGGWNCDRHPSAATSSFCETLIPLRALALYSRMTGNEEAQRSAERAAEVFLCRKLFRRRRDGKVIKEQFTRLHFPCYWRYDILFGLKVMAESGFIGDPRCKEALDLLESKELPSGGWAAEERFYRTGESGGSGVESMAWGRTGKQLMNEWVTADALTVLKAAGRLASAK